MKILQSILIFLIPTALIASSGSVTGVVTAESGYGLEGAHVVLKYNDQIEQIMYTDSSGNYEFTNVEPGSYTVTFTYTGYQPISRSIKVSSGQIYYLDVTMKMGVGLDTLIIRPDPPKLVDPGIPDDRTIFTADDIKLLPKHNIPDIISTSPKVYSQDDGESPNIGGSRTYSSGTYLDGVRINGEIQIPIAAIYEINVITSGIPAKYGDVTSGIIEVVTVRP